VITSVVEKQLLVTAGATCGQVILYRLGHFALQLNGARDHTLASTNTKHPVDQVNIIYPEVNQLRYPQACLEKHLQNGVIAGITAGVGKESEILIATERGSIILLSLGCLNTSQ
jgi:hypothetical protein